jgi:hypothetical protein
VTDPDLGPELSIFRMLQPNLRLPRELGVPVALRKQQPVRGLGRWSALCGNFLKGSCSGVLPVPLTLRDRIAPGPLP